jgi:hypothetical protein
VWRPGSEGEKQADNTLRKGKARIGCAGVYIERERAGPMFTWETRKGQKVGFASPLKQLVRDEAPA